MKIKFPNHTNKINHYLKIGMYGAKWYNETYKTLQFIFGKDACIFCDMLSATSPNQSVKGNVTIALKAYRQYKNDEDFTGYLPIVKNMLDVIKSNYITNQHKIFGGSKVQSFAEALKGNLNAVVVDRWMLRAFGYDEKKGITDKKYRDITTWINNKAKQTGLYPAEIQAAIWCGIKEIEDNTGFSTDTIESHLLKFSLNNEDAIR